MSYRNCWSELGLEGPAEEREIKRAYARRLKQTRPEDDAAGFQRLREAYEEALACTRAAADDESVAGEGMPGPAPAPMIVAAPRLSGVAPLAEPPPELPLEPPALRVVEPAPLPPPEAGPDPAAVAAEQRREDLFRRLWALNLGEDAAGVRALLDAARTQLSREEMREVEDRLKHICAFDERTSAAFFRVVDEVFAWARSPLVLAGEAARQDHALQARREHWQARERLDGGLGALSAALTAGEWEQAAHLGARLEEMLKELPLDWREWLEPQVVARVAEAGAMPTWLLERFHAAWSGGGDYARARQPGALLLEQRLEGERFWREIEDVRSGKLQASWHYQRAVNNLFARPRTMLLWRWRSLYGMQQQMTRDMLLTMGTHFPHLLERLDPRVVAWWRVQRPALGVYPDRWITLALFLSHAGSGVVLAFPGPWTAWLLLLFHLLVVPGLAGLRIWAGWRWSGQWRDRIDAWEYRLTRRLLPSRWAEAAEQHYRLPEFLLRGALLTLIPAFFVAVILAVGREESTPRFFFGIWVLLSLGAQFWFLRRALRGELPPLPAPGQRFAVKEDDTANQSPPWLARAFLVLLIFVVWAKAMEYVG